MVRMSDTKLWWSFEDENSPSKTADTVHVQEDIEYLFILDSNGRPIKKEKVPFGFVGGKRW